MNRAAWRGLLDRPELFPDGMAELCCLFRDAPTLDLRTLLTYAQQLQSRSAAARLEAMLLEYPLHDPTVHVGFALEGLMPTRPIFFDPQYRGPGQSLQRRCRIPNELISAIRSRTTRATIGRVFEIRPRPAPTYRIVP